MTPLQRFGILFLFLCIGNIFGIGFGCIFYVIRKKNDTEITLNASIMKIIIPSMFAFVTIGILVILKIEYNKISVHLLIISGILLAGFMTALSTKQFLVFIIIFGLIIIEIGFDHLIKKIKEYIKNKADKIKESAMKEEEISKIRSKIILGSAPNRANLNNDK